MTATAGHNMEAMLAAYGSGAARVSYEQGLRILERAGRQRIGAAERARQRLRQRLARDALARGQQQDRGSGHRRAQPT